MNKIFNHILMITFSTGWLLPASIASCAFLWLLSGTVSAHIKNEALADGFLYIYFINTNMTIAAIWLLIAVSFWTWQFTKEHKTGFRIAMVIFLSGWILPAWLAFHINISAADAKVFLFLSGEQFFNNYPVFLILMITIATAWFWVTLVVLFLMGLTIKKIKKMHKPH